jgi:ADP-ribose pyrophosphatase
MVRGYRHGPRKVCLNVPGGLIEPGKSPLEAARRELLEETGYRADEWVALGRFTVDSNRQGGTAHLFLAKKARQVESKVEDDAEELQVELMSAQHFLEAVRKHDIATLGTVSAVALALANGLG